MPKVRYSIQPLGYRILVKPDKLEKEHQVEGTDITLEIVHHDERLWENAQIKGTVLAVGEKAYKPFSRNYDGQPWVRVGDRIFYARHAGKFIEDPVTEERLLLLNDDDVTAVMRDEVKEVETDAS